MNVLTFLNGLRPSIPMSIERPCTATSNSELRRWIDGGMVEINGLKVKCNDEIAEVNSIVFFPKSKKRTTIW